MTGIEYPKITLGGAEYEVKVTRASLYRLGKAGIEITPRFNPKGVAFSFSNLVDIFTVVCGFAGSAEDAAELLYDQRNEFAGKLMQALGKLSPLPIPTPDEAAATVPVQ